MPRPCPASIRRSETASARWPPEIRRVDRNALPAAQVAHGPRSEPRSLQPEQMTSSYAPIESGRRRLIALAEMRAAFSWPRLACRPCRNGGSRASAWNLQPDLAVGTERDRVDPKARALAVQTLPGSQIVGALMQRTDHGRSAGQTV